ncbi:ActS/PrrB/RegB family redox-sensitive histidine kinase [Enterovirga rhinocerotis]|uniref:histidine kinase n=1 Tax=Enterovirga rhinocerotis TaxID=1339210 RepID=A0A4R7BX46_9HYPH|nr:ActS/PrrB/RegB family redox-sensitive histidine kinase [Enterovirga rhinocerotis]TDR89255.1 two-component system sensor histidine kinase RegB [Enterovirga rhinocerotis]
MIDHEILAFGREARRLKVDTLVRLRWLAVTGQCLAVALVKFQLGYKLPFAFCVLAIAASVAVNLWLQLRSPASYRLSDDFAFALLAFDIVQLAVLLFLTGGLQNPFAILFLAPVLMSAASLSPMRTLGLGLVAAACASILARYHMALPWSPPGGLDLPWMYVAGIWAAILLGLAFTGAFAYRIAEEARQLGDALAATELVLAREQHLSQLDGLAAAAAHELGTPLATIRLVAKELANQAEPDSAIAEDIALLRGEVERCRVILSKLTSLGDDDEAGFFAIMSLGQLLEEVAGPDRALDVEIEVERSGEGTEPMCRRSPGLIYGLGNLLDNAADFARTKVSMTARWTDETVSIEIADDGPGFAPDVLLRIGEPYVTTRGRGRDGEGSGLGLGLFIAKTLIERSRGNLTLLNAGPQGGAVARIVWAREEFERDVRSNTDDAADGLTNAEIVPISP